MIINIIFLIVLITIFFAFFYKLNTDFKERFNRWSEEQMFQLGFIKTTKDSISIQKSLDNVKLPIIKMTIQGKRYSFLVDTGADYGLLDTNIFNSLNNSEIKKEVTSGVTGISGEITEAFKIKLPLFYNKKLFEEEFFVTNLKGAIDSFKGSGEEIIGVLGSNFFNKHKWSIDFNRMVIWIP